VRLVLERLLEHSADPLGLGHRGWHHQLVEHDLRATLGSVDRANQRRLASHRDVRQRRRQRQAGQEEETPSHDLA
jgi:hypothetical protein